MSNRKQRRRNQPRGGVVAGPGGPSGAPLSPDELVFGNAAQLRRMAQELERGSPTSQARVAASARARVTSYQRRHPDADLDMLVGRPMCETPDAGRARPDRVPVRVVTAGSGAAEIWVDDYIEPPNMWGEGVSGRSVREALDEIGSRDVVVHMNSGGGDYFEGVAIYQALAQHPGDVYIAVDALAASAASVVAMAGDTVGIGRGAFIMIHEASAFAYGNASDLLRIADMLDAIGDEIAGFYAARGKNTAAEFRTAMVAETWYGPDAAIAAGLADEPLAVPAVDPEPVDTDDDSDDDAVIDPDVAALFAWARPANHTPAPPAPAEVPDPIPADPFRDDMEDVFA